MTVSLTPELDDFVHKQIESGRFASASEVVRAALRLLGDEEQDRQAKREALRAWVRESLDDERPNMSKDDVLQQAEMRLSQGKATKTHH